MTVEQKALPKWILIVSGIFALLELLVSVAICAAPESVLESVDFTAKGVTYLAYMWAARQAALGFIFVYATFKRSAPMLTICYLFFLIMMVGDMVIGISQGETSLIISALVMALIAAGLLLVLKRRSNDKRDNSITR
jgi:hypothetical protein